ncbi:MAG: hypothetical protein Q4G68_15025 [Planctomycetia bacterium]|nr:hypothetical protein [Planctomycetia bacterium]
MVNELTIFLPLSPRGRVRGFCALTLLAVLGLVVFLTHNESRALTQPPEPEPVFQSQVTSEMEDEVIALEDEMDEDFDLAAPESPGQEEAEITSFPIAASEPTATGCPLTQNESLWATFAPGSWIRTRTTGTCSDGTNSKSVTETKLTLLAIEDDGVLLRREVAIKMGTASHVKEPEIIKYDFFDMLITPDLTIQEQPAAGLTISRKVIPCNVRCYTKHGDQRQEETLLWYSPVVSPHILQKENRIWSSEPDGTGTRRLLGYSQMTVAKTSSHVRIGNTLGTWRSQTTALNGVSKITTKTFYSSKIPGGVLKETSVETDPDGKILYHSNTVLLDYFAPRS